MVPHEFVTTAFELPGYRITRNLGIVRGIVVRSRSIVGTIGASLQTIVGGNISLFSKLCEQTRNDAFDLMLQHAEALGANAVIGVRYDATGDHAGRHRSAVLRDRRGSGAHRRNEDPLHQGARRQERFSLYLASRRSRPGRQRSLPPLREPSATATPASAPTGGCWWILRATPMPKARFSSTIPMAASPRCRAMVRAARPRS